MTACVFTLSERMIKRRKRVQDVLCRNIVLTSTLHISTTTANENVHLCGVAVRAESSATLAYLKNLINVSMFEVGRPVGSKCVSREHVSCSCSGTKNSIFDTNTSSYNDKLFMRLNGAVGWVEVGVRDLYALFTYIFCTKRNGHL